MSERKQEAVLENGHLPYLVNYSSVLHPVGATMIVFADGMLQATDIAESYLDTFEPEHRINQVILLVVSHIVVQANEAIVCESGTDELDDPLRR